jgi:hypothetical protein
MQSLCEEDNTFMESLISVDCSDLTLDEVYGYKFQPRQMPDFESSIIWV